MDLAPIVLFVYNRPWHTEQTLTALAANDLAGQSELYIYADGPKTGATAETVASIDQTRNVIRRSKWCKEVNIIELAENRGLANSIIRGVTEIVNKHGRVIVLEDDLVIHPFFLTYMNHYLDVYEHEELVISVHGFMYPVKKKISAPFFLKGADCWGWATWKRGWDLFEPDSQSLLAGISKRKLGREFNFDNSYDYVSLLEAQVAGKVDSWAIRWYAAAFLADKLTLYPPVSLVRNIGFDGSGTHGDQIETADHPTWNFNEIDLVNILPAEDKQAKKQVQVFFKGEVSLARVLKHRLRKLLLRKN